MSRICLKPLYGRRIFLFLISVLFFGSLGMVAEPQNPIVIKLASLAPANSEWHDALLDMRQAWLEASNGLVQLEIFPSGQGGEEVDVLRRMKMGRFQAGGFTLAGLQAITPSVVVLALPRAMETQEDLHRVRATMGPKLEEVFLEQGFVLLHWADLGWMQFFVPDSVFTPEEVMSYKYVEWGDNKLTHVWRDAGFNPGTRLNIADVTMGLQTGLVEAINTAPLVVAGYQWFRHVPYMVNLRWGPLSGATLVDRRAWERIPVELRPELLRISKETGDLVASKLVEWEAEAIEAMQEHGLRVVDPPPDVMAEWIRVFERSRELLRGDIVPADWYDETLRIGAEGKDQ